jgi:hypothetical protein
VPVIVDEFELVEAPTAGDEHQDHAADNVVIVPGAADAVIGTVRQAARRAARLRAD